MACDDGFIVTDTGGHIYSVNREGEMTVRYLADEPDAHCHYIIRDSQGQVLAADWIGKRLRLIEFVHGREARVVQRFIQPKGPICLCLHESAGLLIVAYDTEPELQVFSWPPRDSTEIR